MANIGYIQVNRHCNNSCHFCSNPSNGENITLEEGKERIDDFVKKGYQGVIFTGGEPTLSPDLARWIEYATKVGMDCRIISNGMMCANRPFMKRLAESGLRLAHFSIYSFDPRVHDFLTDTPGSWKKLMLSVRNAVDFGVRVQVNTVINHYNQEHLDLTVKFLVRQFPQVRHFVWNNLDPEMMRKTDAAWSTLPDFDAFSPSLRRAMGFLESTGRTFRAERVPLCFMRGFEHFSTETRKIVKDEERTVHFLDFRETVHEKGSDFFHQKPHACAGCDLTAICAGVYEHKKYFPDVKVRPQKLSADERAAILKRITPDD